MKVNHQFVINYAKNIIDVQFLILHYSSLNLNQTLNHFNNPKSQVSSHFVIDASGEIFHCVQALHTKDLTKVQVKTAWHCGESYFESYKNLNQYAIGIELINPNGNFYPYTKNQYISLIELTKKLVNYYPSLANNKRIIGHEHIAGFRGKIDPGYCFDWQFFLSNVFSNFDKKYPVPQATIDKNLLKQSQQMLAQIKNKKQTNHYLFEPSYFWSNLNQWLEISQKQINLDSNY